MEEKQKIELADGTCLENLSMNGNNYIADTTIEKETFNRENLIGVKINEEEHNQMVLDGYTVEDGKTWFILRDMTQQELKDIDIASKLEYLAMELGVEL